MKIGYSLRLAIVLFAAIGALSAQAEPEIVSEPLMRYGLGMLSDAAYSPDGKTIVSCGAGGLVLWDAETGRRIRVLTQSSHTATSLALSPNGRFAATGGWEGGVVVWDLESGATTLLDYGMTPDSYGGVNRASSVAFSPDGALIAAGGEDRRGATKIWRVGESVKPETVASVIADSLQFSPDGIYLVATTEWEQFASLIRVADGQVVRTFRSRSNLEDGAFSPDGSKILAGARNGEAYLWNIDDNTAPLQTYAGHTGIVQTVSFSPDGTRIATGGSDLTVKLWDVNSPASPIHSFTLGNPQEFGWTALGSAEFSPDGQRLLTASSLQDIEIWDVDDENASLLSLRGHTKPCLGAAISAAGDRILTAHWEEPAVLWDVLDGATPIRTFGSRAIWSYAAAFSPDGRLALTSDSDGVARLWDVDDNSSPIQTFGGLPALAGSVTFSSDGTKALAGCDNGTAVLWDVASGTTIQEFSGTLGNAREIDLSFDDSLVLVGGNRSDQVELWDAGDSSAPIRTFSPGEFSSLAFSPDGKMMLTGSSGRADLWDIENNSAPVRVFSKQEYFDSTPSVGFSPDGTRILTAETIETPRWETSVSLWDIADESEPLRLFISHGGGSWINTTAFSRDGSKFLTAGSYGLAMLWSGGTPAFDVSVLGRPEYRVGTLNPGEPVYGDRTYEFAEPIADDLLWQPYIRTLNNDKDAVGIGFLRFEVDRPVTVVVAHDARFPSPPSWLRFWNKREDVLITTDTYGPERVLYERDFPAGVIRLGANRDPGMPENLSMYSVILAPRGPKPAMADEWLKYR